MMTVRSISSKHTPWHYSTHIRRNKCSQTTKKPHIDPWYDKWKTHWRPRVSTPWHLCRPSNVSSCHMNASLSPHNNVHANNLLFNNRHSSHTQRFNCKCAEPPHRAFIWRENHNVIPSHPLWHEAMDIYEPIWYLDGSGLALQSLNCNGPIQWLYNIFLELMLIALLYIFRTKAFSIIIYIEGGFFFFFFPLPLPTLFP